MIFEIECESKVGKEPKKHTHDNQDAFFFRKNEKWCCLCIADGAGSKRHSSLGAKWVTYDISEYLIENADELLIDNECTIREKIVLQIEQSLNKTVAILEVAYTDLSSTLICVLTNGDKCLLLHLGDGVILAKRKGTLNVLSFPKNGTSKRSTALTTMDSPDLHLRIQKESCKDIGIIWLMTDGAMYEVFQENYGLNGEELSIPLIRTKLAANNSDDATYGYIKWRIENE